MARVKHDARISQRWPNGLVAQVKTVSDKYAVNMTDLTIAALKSYMATLRRREERGEQDISVPAS